MEKKVKVNWLDPAYLVIFCYAMLILSRFIMRGVAEGSNEYLAVVILQLLTFALPAAIWYRLRTLPRFAAREAGEGKPPYLRRLRFNAPRLSHLPAVFFTVLVLICGCLLLSIGLSSGSSLEGSFSLYDVFVSSYDGKALGAIWLVLAYAALPAICEELVFRGIVCTEYDGSGFICSVLMNALFFGFMHFSFKKLAIYLFAGAVLTVLLYTTRSVFSVMIAHFLYNLFCIFGQPYITEFYVTAGSVGTAVVILIALLIAGLAGFCGGARRLFYGYAETDPPTEATEAKDEDRSEEPKKQGEKLVASLRTCLLTPGVAVCVVIFLAFGIIFLLI